MTSCFHMARLPRAITLLSLLAGCGSSPSNSADLGTNTPRDSDLPSVCPGAGTPTRYRITTLHIPTSDDVTAGNVAIGHNVDHVGTVCSVPDHPGGVDNALIELAEALPNLAPDDPIDLQAEIDNALNCPVDAPASECTRLDLFVSVATGDGCVLVSVLDEQDATLAGPFAGSLASNGDVRGEVPQLALAIPYQTPTGAVDINLAVSGVILTANLSATSLSNIVLGGSLERTAFEQTIMDLLPLLGSEITFESIAPILAGLYDVQVDGTCAALSVGLTGAATVIAAP